MAHGGSLTINPQTGLPEAGFLKNILPTVLGIALTPFMGPLAAGLTVGGVETVRTGDIGKGFLAGLGAYGGAQIGGALGGASAATAAPAAGAGGIEFANAASPEFLASQGAGVAPTAVAPSTLGTTVNPVTFGDTGAAIYGGAPSQAMLSSGSNALEGVAATDSVRFGAQNAPSVAAGARPTYGQMGQGFKDLFTQEGGLDRFIGQAATPADEKRGVEAVKATGLGGGYGAAKTAAMAGAPMIMDALTPKPYEPPAQEKDEFEYEGPYTPSQRRVSYPADDERRRRTSEFTYFNPSNPVPFAEGGESKASPDVVVSPNEARVYQDILNVQRLAGLPALDPNRFAVMPGRSYEQFVYNPIDTGVTTGQGGGEKDYGIKSLSSQKNNLFGGAGTIVYRKSGSEYTPFLVTGELDPKKYEYDPAVGGYVVKPSAGDVIGSMFRFGKGGGYASGGRVSVPQLEDGGFVLTKKAVDGLGKGDNKKGQKVASRGLGAIPIRGKGTGTSDSIKTSIEGKRPALVSNGEAYVPKKQVAKRGGAKAFYALMDKAEKQAKKAKRA
jgi:hypothetical protein